MRLRTIRKNMNLAGKRVLVRIDGNVPLKNGKVVDGKHGRIARASVDLNWLMQRGAKVIVMTHLNRPKGKRVSAYSIKPVAKRLGALLGTKVQVARDIVGERVEKMSHQLEQGGIMMVENVRFDARESRNSPAFASKLAKLGDLYVNDAFSASHRAHASVDAIASELPAYAGPLFDHEVSILRKLTKHPKKPFFLAMGGLKLQTKLPVMERLLPHVHGVLLGGALANTFFAALGMKIGKSVYAQEEVKLAKALMEKWGRKLFLPEDVVVATSFRKNAKSRITRIGEVKANERIVDIGPKTMKHYTEHLSRARTIVWNGPFGYCEIDAFCKGTEGIARSIAKQTGKAVTVVGGGDTVPYVENLGIFDKFSLVSTGGGAMLAFLAGDTLPGVEAIKL